MNQMKNILPGLNLCIFITILANFFGNIYPSLGSTTFAILIGLVFGNTIFKSQIFQEGSKFSENNLLSYSIVLMGGTLSIKSIEGLGFKGIVFIVLQMSFTILVSIGLGKKLGFSRKFQSLMAVGNSVCGSSAIGALSPVIGVPEKDKGISITIVNLTGTILMFLLIPISKEFFPLDTIKTSAFLGGILQSMGQVVATGSLMDANIQEMSILFKVLRIVFLVIVVMIFSKRHKSDEIAVKKKKNSLSIPWYIIGFFFFCILYSFGFISFEISKIFKLISSKLEIIAIAGIGMRIRLEDLINQGPKASLYGLGIGSTQIIIGLALIKLIF